MNLLIDDVEFLDHNLTLIMKDLDSVSVGVGAMRRLERINNTVYELRVGRKLIWLGILLTVGEYPEFKRSMNIKK